jgi:hypothetical protein
MRVLGALVVVVLISLARGWLFDGTIPREEDREREAAELKALMANDERGRMLRRMVFSHPG